MKAVPVSVRYNLVDDDHHLDAYDAGVALLGMSKSLSLSTHYLLNGHIIKQAPALSGADIYLLPARSGSFVFDFNVLMSPDTFLGAASASVAAAIFWDFIKCIYSRTAGKEYVPTNSHVRDIVDSKVGDVDTLVDTIETDVLQVHRPIIHNASSVVIFHGDNNMVRFDGGTYDYVKTAVRSDDSEIFIGNVSAFNANSGNGRLYISDFGRTVSFYPHEDRFSNKDRTLLTWSLSEYVNGRKGLLEVEAGYISTQSGLIKKLEIVSVRRFVR